MSPVKERQRIAALVPAYNEGNSIRKTVEALLAVPEIDLIIVVDDGSVDHTAGVVAGLHNPRVQLSRIPRNRGKGAALNHGMKILESQNIDIFVFCDADLGDSAREVRKLLLPVLADKVDMTTALLPDTGSVGGLGIVVGLARYAIHRLTGRLLRAPLSGQRAFTAEVWSFTRPCAGGYGAETVMTTRALRAGFEVKEVPVEMFHNVTDNSLAGIMHRFRQLIDVGRGLIGLLLQSRRHKRVNRQSQYGVES